MSYLSDVQSVYQWPGDGLTPSAGDRLEIEGLPTICWLRALYVSFQGAVAAGMGVRIDFVTASTGGVPSDGDSDWLCSVGYGYQWSGQSVVYPDDSYLEIVKNAADTTGLYVTSNNADALARTAVTVIYT